MARLEPQAGLDDTSKAIKENDVSRLTEDQNNESTDETKNDAPNSRQKDSVKTYYCDKCNHTSSGKSALKRHCQSKHEGRDIYSYQTEYSFQT